MRSSHARGLALCLALGSRTESGLAQTPCATEVLCPCPRAPSPSTSPPAPASLPGQGRAIAAFSGGAVLLGLGVGLWAMRERSASEFNRDCWLVGDDGVSTDGCGARYDQVLVSHIGAISAWGLSAGLLTLGTVFAVIDRRARAPAAHAAPAWWITAGPTALGASVGGRF